MTHTLEVSPQHPGFEVRNVEVAGDRCTFEWRAKNTGQWGGWAGAQLPIVNGVARWSDTIRIVFTEQQEDAPQ